MLRTYNLVSGIVCIVAGVALLVGAAMVPVAALGLALGAVGCFAAGGFCLWWHYATKDTILATRPIGMRSGMANMASATAASNAYLASMVNANNGAVATAHAVAAQGAAARARVDQVVDTGAIVNGAHVVDVHVTVTVPGQAPFAATVRETLSPVGLAQVQAGADVSASVDPGSYAVMLNLPVR
jgi:hypothetical protein